MCFVAYCLLSIALGSGGLARVLHGTNGHAAVQSVPRGLLGSLAFLLDTISLRLLANTLARQRATISSDMPRGTPSPQGNRQDNVTSLWGLINTLLLVLIHVSFIYGVFNNNYLILDVKLIFVATLVEYVGYLSKMCGFCQIFCMVFQGFA